MDTLLMHDGNDTNKVRYAHILTHGGATLNMYYKTFLVIRSVINYLSMYVQGVHCLFCQAKLSFLIGLIATSYDWNLPAKKNNSSPINDFLTFYT